MGSDSGNESENGLNDSIDEALRNIGNGTGSGTGSDSNPGNGEGKQRRRRRTKAEIEAGVNLLDDDMPATSRKRNPKSPISEEAVAQNLSLVFNFIAGMRGPHWSKSPTDTLPLARPLAHQFNNMPDEAKKLAEKWLGPGQLLVGAIIVLSGPISTEIQNMEGGKNVRSQSTGANGNTRGHQQGGNTNFASGTGGNPGATSANSGNAAGGGNGSVRRPTVVVTND